ncbi:hypothetical protein RHSIM_RhsimUnG0225200 [Rhododendron simsii]|uniref:Uncharacterized protein n=1 Tax=Rhododendron simsii TaxID=118357 RepID=A0A834L3E8_RHOSS|nr:hypothetical protein RHSIM_RhsimUnG0225200 [Rhododendron simsii]
MDRWETVGEEVEGIKSCGVGRIGSTIKVPNVASKQPIIRASMGNGIQDGDQVTSPLPAHSPQLDGVMFSFISEKLVSVIF